MIRKPGLAESQCLLGLSPGWKAECSLPGPPSLWKDAPTFSQRKASETGGGSSAAVCLPGCGDLGFSPQQHKQQQATTPREKYFPLGFFSPSCLISYGVLIIGRNPRDEAYSLGNLCRASKSEVTIPLHRKLKPSPVGKIALAASHTDGLPVRNCAGFR